MPGSRDIISRTKMENHFFRLSLGYWKLTVCFCYFALIICGLLFLTATCIDWLKCLIRVKWDNTALHWCSVVIQKFSPRMRLKCPLRSVIPISVFLFSGNSNFHWPRFRLALISMSRRYHHDNVICQLQDNLMYRFLTFPLNEWEVNGGRTNRPMLSTAAAFWN